MFMIYRNFKQSRLNVEVHVNAKGYTLNGKQCRPLSDGMANSADPDQTAPLI